MARTQSNHYGIQTHPRINNMDMMSPHEFWWNHLSFQQQTFCRKEFYKCADEDSFTQNLGQWAYANKEILHNNPDWPTENFTRTSIESRSSK